MNQSSVIALMRAIAPTIRDYLSDAIRPLHGRIAVLEQAPKPATDDFIRHVASEAASEAALAAASLIREQFDDLPVPQDGKSVTVEDVRPILAEMVAALPAPKEGKDADPQMIQAAVDKAVAALPPPKDGASVTVEDARPILAEMVAALPVPQDGKDADPKEMAALITTEVAKAVAAIPIPENGKSVTLEDVRPVLADLVGALPKPKDVADEHRQRLDAHAGNIDKLLDEIESLKIRQADTTPIPVPDDIADLVSRAAALLAEPMPQAAKASSAPLIVQMAEPRRPVSKHISISRTPSGELSAIVTERDVA